MNPKKVVLCHLVCTALGTYGDVVEVYNNHGSSYAMAYLEKDMKPGQNLKGMLS